MGVSGVDRFSGCGQAQPKPDMGFGVKGNKGESLSAVNGKHL